jgi:HD-GYP domain-containing protein (c-di-GMP phosphodiesterase class II)
MRRVPTAQLRAGDRIGRDVYSRPDLPPLLRAGVRISDSFRESLQRAGVAEVWIDDVISEGIEPLEVLSADTKQRTSAAIRDAFRAAEASVATGQMMSPKVINRMAEVAELIVKEVTANVHAALALNDLANADGYTMKHSLAVTTLGLSLGLRVMQRYGWIDERNRRRFDSVEDRLLPLGVGLLLHDIGKLAVPIEIIQKPGKLTAEEWVAIKSHPMEGVRILQQADISPLTRAVVRSHHERWDGAGYPEQRCGTDIHQFPRIAAVADVFDALTSDRHYRRAWTMHDGWQFIVDRSGVEFDPEVVDVFRRSVAPFPPGTAVILSDGSRGIVKEVSPTAVTRPVVRLLRDASGAAVPFHDLNLALAPEITIVSTDCDASGEAAA